MNNFSYSAVRSFNQFLNGSLSMGTDEQLILTPDPMKKLDRDSVIVEFYDSVPVDFCGRQVGGGKGNIKEMHCQIDVYSPPNSQGQPRSGANRQLMDRVDQVFKSNVRIPLISYGTAGTSQVGGMYVRREKPATLMNDDTMEGWSRWRMEYLVRATDTE